MTTKPKAKKFRIRRTSPLSNFSGGGESAAPAASAAPAPQSDGFGARPYPTSAAASNVATATAADTSAQVEVNAETEISSIRHEGLTGRQLRMARRVAQKHGLPATSDFDAVRLLRRAGIDPFQRSTMLELVSNSGDAAPAPTPGGTQLPQIVRPAQLPSTEVQAEANRASDIMAIQRDIARRRRRKMALLATRLFFFVTVPTILVGYYFFAVATPLYATKTEFVIQQAQPAAGGAGQLGGLFSGTGFATSQDSIAVQGYLQSRDAMIRLDQDLQYRAHFSDPSIDPVQRLDADASNESAYKNYKRNVKISYDPSEGIIKMEVIAAEPKMSEAFSRALISYAEEQVDHLTQRLREDQMKGARESFEDAEAKMLDSQRKMVELQESYKVLSSEVEVGLLTSRITALEAQLTQENLRLQEMLSNPNPNQARLVPLQGRIETLKEEIGKLRAKLNENNSEGVSLAKIQSELLVAQADVQTRQMMLAQSLQQLETARIEANRQVRYLSLSVSPVAPDEATYPRALENTIVAFLIFGGIYLMLSMTASILREQVSA